MTANRATRLAIQRLFRVVGTSDRVTRHSDPVAFADLMTSGADCRIAINIAAGVPLDEIDPASGHSSPGALAAARATESRHREWCADRGHPGTTYNPLMGLTWCACGLVITVGDTATHDLCCPPAGQLTLFGAS
ncbi:hypothetical protein SAMN05444157_1599 [Frankineae bacterium MT45]|nr:hypothetical protein SAMN05444157_1599 [Frankineae bacterium MT45]